MKRLVLLALLLAMPVGAADGDFIASHVGKIPGEEMAIETFLCDGDKSATSCAEIDLLAIQASANSTASTLGWPSRMVYSLRATTDCPLVSIELRGRDTAGASVEHTLMTAGTHGATALTGAGVSAVQFERPAFRYVVGIVTPGAGCTGSPDVEVILRTFYPARP